MNIFMRRSLETLPFIWVPVSAISHFKPVVLSITIGAYLFVGKGSYRNLISHLLPINLSPFISMKDLVKKLVLPIYSKALLNSGWKNDKNS